MQYSAIVTDLDGTAVDSPAQKQCSERLAIAIRSLESRGVKVCAATGRPETFATPVLDSMQLSHPAIVSGGSRIIHPVTHEELWACAMTKLQMKEVIALLGDTNYGCLWNDYEEADYESGGWPVTRYNPDTECYFFEICYVEPDVAHTLARAITEIEGVTATVVVAQREGLKDIHVTNAEATKEHAIYELQRIIGVTKDQTVGIGDGHNDLHLFSAVGHKVAMGNAVTELKDVADEVIGSVKDDGLAQYFEQLSETGDKQ